MRNYYYYSTGRILHDRDLSACLEASSSPPGPTQTPLQQQPPPEGPIKILPFRCRTEGGCKCGIASSNLPRESSIYDGPLPSDDHIRLMEILPGHSDMIECRLHVASLPQDRYTYCALSYTWALRSNLGRDDETKIWIKVNGVSIQVSFNLATALHRLRFADASRIVWADALCINQDDVAERNHQVGKMKSIYENAFSLVIWLGPGRRVRYNPAPPVHLRSQYRAFSAVCSVVNAWRKRSGYADIIPEATHSRSYSRPRGEQFNEELQPESQKWYDIFELFEQCWFSRVWVIQEVALARHVMVVWDEASIHWEYIGLAAAVIRTNYDRIARSVREGPKGPATYGQLSPNRSVPLGVVNAYFMYRLSRSQAYNKPLKFSFYELLKLTRQFDCKDDRDRVYGLLRLPTTDNLSTQIVPDYTKSAGQVYFEVARKMVDREGLSILSSVQRKHKTGAMRIYYVPRWEEYDPSIPSWVPQWSFLLARSLRPPHQSRSCGFRASGDKPCRYELNEDDPRKLTVQGLIIDTVKSCWYPGFESFWRGMNAAEENRKLYKQQRKFRERDLRGRGPSLGERLDKARLTQTDLGNIALDLTAGQNWYGFPVEDVSAHLADYCRCLLKDGLAWSVTLDMRKKRDDQQADELDEKARDGREDYVTLQAGEALGRRQCRPLPGHCCHDRFTPCQVWHGWRSNGHGTRGNEGTRLAVRFVRG